MNLRLILTLLAVLHILKEATAQNATTTQNSTVQKPPTYVNAVSAGFPITKSSFYPQFQYNVPRLNASNYCWEAGISRSEEWIQVSSIQIVKWVGVIIQGRGNYPQWVTAFTVSYTVDGVAWLYVDDLRVFQGNRDQETLVKNMFTTPVLGRAIRINPISWRDAVSLRFDAIFEA